jgi:hypothetical protein
MRLSGPETGDVYTALDGSYSFAVTTPESGGVSP